MTSGGRRKSIAFFIVLGVGLVGGALALNVGWVIVSWRNAGLLLAGIVVFPLIITGVVLNTIFLVREIRRNEQHEAFINAVTHELKTPVASMKLYLQTLQNRAGRRRETPGVLRRDARRQRSPAGNDRAGASCRAGRRPAAPIGPHPGRPQRDRRGQPGAGAVAPSSGGGRDHLSQHLRRFTRSRDRRRGRVEGDGLEPASTTRSSTRARTSASRWNWSRPIPGR